MPGLIEEPVLTKKELRKRNKELKKQKKEEARKSKQAKKKEKQIQYESIDLGERAGEEFVYVPLNKKKRKDFLDTVAITDVKSILYGYPNQPIRLANGYSGYVQIFEVFGQDIQAMSNEEQAAIKVGFTLFLSGTAFDMMIQTTKLPTDVSSQSNELLRLLDEVKQEQNAPELIINDGDDLCCFIKHLIGIANQTFRCDDGHLRIHAVIFAFVDGKCGKIIARFAGNYACKHGVHGRARLIFAKQRTQLRIFLFQFFVQNTA